MNRRDLLKIHPWLRVKTTVGRYIEPYYYKCLLKPYVFKGLSDLEYFKNYISKGKNFGNVLELGCGSGRATEVFFKTISKYGRLNLVDLSSRMLGSAKNKFKKKKNIKYVCSDAVNYIQKTQEVFDLVFSLWSFSHSTHQLLSRVGLREGEKIIRRVVEKLVIKNMRMGSKFFLIHFDSRSEEQKILIRQWKRIFSIFKVSHLQSPSKRYLDEVFLRLEKQGIIKFSCRHLTGEKIKYNNIKEALEIFMNFHMESYFNNLPMAEDVINDLISYFKKFQDKNGVVSIRPGCFIYTFTRIS